MVIDTQNNMVMSLKWWHWNDEEDDLGFTADVLANVNFQPQRSDLNLSCSPQAENPIFHTVMVSKRSLYETITSKTAGTFQFHFQQSIVRL